ncbi:MAG: nucleotidyltransferase domain-containing protein [Bacteroidota bacterium]
MTQQQIFNKISDYFKDKPVKKVSVFGSYATGNFNSSSDIDLVLSLVQPVGLLNLSGYRIDLEEQLGIHVDLGTENGISQFVLPYIQKEMKIIYERH